MVCERDEDGAFREIACYIFNVEVIACWNYIPRSMYPEWCSNSTTSLLLYYTVQSADCLVCLSWTVW